MSLLEQSPRPSWPTYPPPPVPAPPTGPPAGRHPRHLLLLLAIAAFVALAGGLTAFVVAGSGGCSVGPDADLVACDFTDRDLSGADLAGADLTDATLTGADLTRADLDGARLVDADLTGAVLVDADLTDAVLDGADLRDADLTGAELAGLDLTDARLADADLRRADLRGAALAGVDFGWADVDGADFSGADLSGADLVDAVGVTGATWVGANLSSVDLSGRDLTGIGLSGASLVSARFTGATLDGADLSGADLSGADLAGVFAAGATFEGAIMSGTILGQNDFMGAVGLTDEMLVAALGVPAELLAAETTVRSIYFDLYDDILSALAPVREGVPAAGVRPYDGSAAFHPAVVLGPGPGTFPPDWAAGLDVAWSPSGVRFAELVIVERETTWNVLEVCEYWSGGVSAPPITRYQATTVVQVLAASTAQVVAEQAFTGTEPRACEASEPYWLEELRGDLPDSTLIVGWLQGIVHPPV